MQFLVVVIISCTGEVSYFEGFLNNKKILRYALL